MLFCVREAERKPPILGGLPLLDTNMDANQAHGSRNIIYSAGGFIVGEHLEMLATQE